jgi:hypothetical protein
MTGVAKQAEQAPRIELWFEFGRNYTATNVLDAFKHRRAGRQFRKAVLAMWSCCRS